MDINRKNVCGIMILFLIVSSFICQRQKEEERETDIADTVISPSQWYLDDSEENAVFLSANSWRGEEKQGMAGVDIAYSEAMKHYTDRRSTIIAVIDTGAAVSWFQDNKNIWQNQEEVPDDGKDNDQNDYVDDVFGWNFIENNCELESELAHGDEIISMLVGHELNEKYRGLLQNTKIEVMNLKAVNDMSDTSSVVNAIQYAENQNADICCMALGVYQDDSALYQIIKESSMLFVVAAGNEGAELGKEEFLYPALYQSDNMITVADIRCDGRISCTSNYSKMYVDIGAPGTDILYAGGENTYTSGTSIAVAIVSACCALVRSNSLAQLTSQELKKIIIYSASSNPELEEYIIEGKHLNLKNALTYVLK